MNLQTAYGNFFKSPKTGFPKFKSKKSNRRSYTTNCVNGNISIDSGYIKLPKVGTVKLKQHRNIPVDYKLKSVTVSQTPSGKYYASVLFEYENQVQLIEPHSFLGLDFSMHELYKDSNGNWLYHYEENPNAIANCVIALNMASRMNTDPLLVMQNLYLIEGRPAWTSQFITGTINSSGRFSALRFDLEDLGEKTVSYTEYVWENNKKTPVEKHITIQDMSCVAWAIERETNERVESTKITLEMAIKEGWFQKNGSKWQTMPQQMLSYRAASFFGRLYAPELLMGLRSAEEEQERSIIDVTPDEYQEQATSATNTSAATLKRDILQSKSLDHLNTLESKITALENTNERDELFKLFNAQKTKLSSQQESSEQNTAPVQKPLS